MHATLDTTAKVLRNDEVITYTNNSPDSPDQPLDPHGAEHLSPGSREG